ncbi:hypothetical protein [Pseudophaeobacter profundi]|uniref:hypothetical protein n=1 Tax=Pseudophaeobacter profundi TaxID=3034152 RepID=UPI0024308CA6|nr:hypothetical protein [Pseudophaeobacter profundi]
MSRLSKKTLQKRRRSESIHSGTVYQQKVAILEHLQQALTPENARWIQPILNRVGRCKPAYRCNSKHCPTCSNAKQSKAVRKKTKQLKPLGKAQATTTSAKSKEYRVRGGQRMMGPFEGLPIAMLHSFTVNLCLVSFDGDLKETKERYHLKLRKVLNKLSHGAIARGKFDIVSKYADDLPSEFPDIDLPFGVSNAALPHTRHVMLHIHFLLFDPWMTRVELRNLFAKEFPGSNRVCARRTRDHTVLECGTMVGGAQGYLEYMCMEKVELPFGDQSADAALEFVQIDSTWDRRNRNFAFGKSISVSGIVIDQDRVKYLERENRLQWIKKNWSKLSYAEKFIHQWMSNGIDILAGIKSLPNYRAQFMDKFSAVLLLHCNWVRLNFFEVIDFVGFMSASDSKLALLEPPD